jgi:hypothetical protein
MNHRQKHRLIPNGLLAMIRFMRIEILKWTAMGFRSKTLLHLSEKAKPGTLCQTLDQIV